MGWVFWLFGWLFTLGYIPALTTDSTTWFEFAVSFIVWPLLLGGELARCVC